MLLKHLLAFLALFAFAFASTATATATATATQYEQLIAAARDGDYPAVQTLLALPEITHEHAGLALQRAAENGHENIVTLLFHQRPGITDNHAGLALQIAALNGRLPTVALILQQRPTITDYGAHWALVNAAYNGHAHVVALILRLRPEMTPEQVLPALQAFIGTYHASDKQPINRSFLWDLEDLASKIADALQDPQITTALSPAQISILNTLQQNTEQSTTFFNYISQNFQYPSEFPTDEKPLFWRSLVFSSFSQFYNLLPDQASQFLQNIPSSELPPSQHASQHHLLLAEGLLHASFDPRNDLASVAGWGHTATIKYTLQHRNDITDHHAGLALRAAAWTGHEAIATFLLLQRPAITDTDAGLALGLAAEKGHQAIATFLLLQRPGITDADAGRALQIAALNGRLPTVALILQQRPRITDAHAGWALVFAAANGHQDIVELLFNTRHDITLDHAGRALKRAAANGHATTVQRILHLRPNISSHNIRTAIAAANAHNHTEIVPILTAHQRPQPACIIS